MEELKDFHQELEYEINNTLNNKYHYNSIFEQIKAASKELIAKCEDPEYDSDSDYDDKKSTKSIVNNNNLIKCDIKWQNGLSVFKKTNEKNCLTTFSTLTPLQRKFMVKIKLNKCYPDTTCIGLTTKLIKDKNQYLGLDKNLIEWSVMGNGTINEEGKFKAIKNIGFKEGDIVCLKFYNGFVSYYVNDIKAVYSYYFNKRTFYIAATLYFDEDEIEILDY